MREGPGAAAAMLCSVVGEGGTRGSRLPSGIGERREKSSEAKKLRSAAGQGPVTLSRVLVSVQTRRKLEMEMGGSSGAGGEMGRGLLTLESDRS